MLRRMMIGALAALGLAACAPAGGQAASASKAAHTGPVEEAVFAGGCFWCAEHDLAKVPGVIDVVSGYSGGALENPTYRNHPGHLEVVKVTYDPARLSYTQLVEAFWPLIDPTDSGGQFCDRGASYRPAIFVTDTQRPIAEASKAQLIASGRVKAPITTEILPFSRFWIAEEYHQDYAEKNPIQYNFYRSRCGRDQRLREVWGSSK